MVQEEIKLPLGKRVDFVTIAKNAATEATMSAVAGATCKVETLLPGAATKKPHKAANKLRKMLSNNMAVNVSPRPPPRLQGL